MKMRILRKERVWIQKNHLKDSVEQHQMHCMPLDISAPAFIIKRKKNRKKIRTWQFSTWKWSAAYATIAIDSPEMENTIRAMTLEWSWNGIAVLCIYYTIHMLPKTQAHTKIPKKMGFNLRQFLWAIPLIIHTRHVYGNIFKGREREIIQLTVFGKLKIIW